MHKNFELKTGRKWNTQETICEWEDIINKDFAEIAPGYVDLIHLTQFMVQLEVFVTRAINMQFQ